MHVFMYAVLLVVGLCAGLLSGSIGFGGGMILLPVITSFYGVAVAVPISTIAQLLSNLSRTIMGWRQIHWSSVWHFLILAAPFTALGAMGFAVIDKPLMTRVLCVFLVVFAIMKLRGKLRLKPGRTTMLVGGGVTGLMNGMLGISGPLSSAVFLTIGLAPVSYIASESTAAAIMHIIKAIVYGKLNLMSMEVFLSGLGIGCAMMLGNFISMRLIRHVDKKKYQKVVAGAMIVVSIWLFITVK